MLAANIVNTLTLIPKNQ